MSNNNEINNDLFAVDAPDDAPDDGNTSEDPINKDPIGKGGGASKTGQVNMFRGYQPKPLHAKTLNGNKEPTDNGILLTPGAKKNPEIGPGPTRGKGRKFA